MVDPISLSMVTSAVTLFCSEMAKGVLGEAGKATYHKLASTLGWEKDAPPRVEDVPELVAKALVESPEKAAEVKDHLANCPVAGAAGQIVVNAKNVGVGVSYGTINQTFN